MKSQFQMNSHFRNMYKNVSVFYLATPKWGE